MAKSDNGDLNQSDLQSDSSDPNNSIFKKVTKRVSGLFPSSFSKWFGPSGEGQSVIRRRESVEEDDEALQIHQPPKKRARPNLEVGDFSSMTSTPLGGGGISSSNSILSRDLHLQAPGPSGFKRHFPVANGDDKSDSGDSTSGYSSVLAQQHKEPSFVSDRGAFLNQPSTSKSSPCPSKTLNTSLNSTRSLFSSDSLNPKRQCLSSRRPSFSASTFGSPSFIDRTLSTKRAVNSPFYSGRTTFGGASAYRRNRFLFPRDEVKNSVSMKPANDGASTENASLSKTARRILETLEHFSSPVLDARKIPNINRQNCDLTKTRTRVLNTTKSGPNNRELLIPSVPDLLKMKQKERLQDSTVQVRTTAVNSKSVLNTEYTLPALVNVRNKEESVPKHTNKMKSKVTSSVREKKTQIGVDYPVDAVLLPDIQLPITNLPKFDFAVAPPPSASLPITKSTISRKEPSTNMSLLSSKMFTPKTTTIIAPIASKTSPKSVLKYNFNFSKPLVLASDIPKSIASINNFKFSDPIDAKAAAVVSNMLTFKASTIGSTAPRKRDNTTSKNNGQQGSGVGLLLPAKKLVEGSVMDVLGNKSNTENDKKPWECSNCLVRNMYCDSRCHACQTLRDKETNVPKKLTDFGSQFKMKSDKWECSACMIRNSISDTKCAACTTPKSGSAVPPSSSGLSSWGDKFKAPSGSWDCSTCMIQNKSGDIKCAACEAPKPGMNSKQAVAATGKIALVVPSTNSSGFDDLVKKQQSNWECSSCMVRNPPERKSCACCEAPKPGEAQQIVLAKPAAHSEFKFGLDKVSSKALASESSALNSGFKFGVSADEVDKSTPVTSFMMPPAYYKSVAARSGFNFGIPAVGSTTVTTAAVSSKALASTISVANSGFNFGIPADGSTTVTPTAAVISSSSTTFAFGTPSVTSKPTSSTFNFGVVTSTSTTATKPLMFGTTDKVVKQVESAPSVGVSSTTATSAPTPSVSLSAAKPAVPQFNFSAPKADNPKTDTKPAAKALPSFEAFKSSSSPSSMMFSFTSAPAKSFAFAPTKPSSPGFAFGPEKVQPAPLSKAPVFNFASGNAGEPASNLFAFGPSKTTAEAPKSAAGTFGSLPSQSAPQNGGFNFGAAANKPNFNFGASPAANTSSSMVGFGVTQSQAGTGSLPAAPGGGASAPTPEPPAAGVFTFGGLAPSFTPEVKSNSLFNTGSFTAPSSSSSTGGQPQRRIRKAVRRTQPRMSGPWPSTD